MLLNTVLSPVNGLFTNMPKDIWGSDFDPTMVDIELFTRIGGLEASPLVEHFTVGGVLDTAGLAKVLHQRYSKNWDRIWKVLIAEYDAFLTSTTKEHRESIRDTEDNETRALTDTGTEVTDSERKNAQSNVKTGSTDRTAKAEETRTETDLETHNLSKTDKGTVGNTGTETQTGNGSTATDHGLYGVGGAGLANESRDVAAETRNFTFGNTNNETRNLDGTESGTVNNARSGKDSSEETNSEIYKDITDALSGTESGNETVKKNDVHSGTVDNTGRDQFTEDFTSEGSSPLRTFQALITEEIEGRSGQAWNFTDIIIRDVQTMIASKIWRRSHGIV